MKNSVFKIGKYFLFAALGIFVLGLSAKTYYQLAIYPGEVRKDCSERALSYIQEKGKSERVYGTAQADLDYKFFYRYCFQEKGLRSEE